jgi:hypothetical protein
MPYAKKKTFSRRRTAVKRRRPFKKTYRKKKAPIVSCKVMKLGQQMFPDRYFVHMRNIWTAAFTGTTGATNAMAILGNGLHLPLAPVTSGAASLTFNTAIAVMGLNLLLGAGGVSTNYIYNSYRVHGHKITLQIQNTSAAAADSGTLIIIPTTDYTSFGNITGGFYVGTMAELPYAKHWKIAGTTMNRGVTVSHFMSTRKMYGLKYKSSIEDGQYDGVYGTNPSQLWAFVVVWLPDTGSTTSLNVYGQSVYTCEFFDRSSPASGSGG